MNNTLKLRKYLLKPCLRIQYNISSSIYNKYVYIYNINLKNIYFADQRMSSENGFPFNQLCIVEILYNLMDSYSRYFKSPVTTVISYIMPNEILQNRHNLQIYKTKH